MSCWHPTISVSSGEVLRGCGAMHIDCTRYGPFRAPPSCPFPLGVSLWAAAPACGFSADAACWGEARTELANCFDGAVGVALGILATTPPQKPPHMSDSK